jgi:uncharacterized protein (DUF2141 family)
MRSFLQIKTLSIQPALVFIAAALLSVSAVTPAANLIVIVSNIQQDSGEVMAGLFFDNPTDFPKSITKGMSVPAKERDSQGRLRITFSDLVPGSYAATVYHDINSDGKLTTNLMKIPSEPYGFSNNARGLFGPPSFKDASITLGEEDLTIEIQIK